MAPVAAVTETIAPSAAVTAEGIVKTAYIDCTFGVSGDMLLGALVACGLPLETLARELEKLHVHGFELAEEAVIDAGIAAVHVDVRTEHQHEHRHLSHITGIIESSGLSENVKANAVRIFTRLAEAEAKVHGTTPEKIHFHEVGALDAIVDVVGACIGFDYFGIERIIATPLHLGTGTVKCAHGLMPVPVPAVVELSAGIPVVRTGIEGEMTTPTGAAIVTTLAESYGAVEGFIAERSGYGAGTRRRPGIPNMVRLTVGETADETGYAIDAPVLVEANIDDMNPELFGYVSERLFEAGALDVYMTPIYMKKGRPGTLLSVLGEQAARDALIDILLTETTTIGVRFSTVQRRKLTRKSGTVDTEYGTIRVKLAYNKGVTRITPEYDDCVRIARERRVPLIRVYDTAKNAGLD